MMNESIVFLIIILKMIPKYCVRQDEAKVTIALFNCNDSRDAIGCLDVIK